MSWAATKLNNIIKSCFLSLKLLLKVFHQVHDTAIKIIKPNFLKFLALEAETN